jgi:hypothetical protein
VALGGRQHLGLDVQHPCGDDTADITGITAPLTRPGSRVVAIAPALTLAQVAGEGSLGWVVIRDVLQLKSVPAA